MKNPSHQQARANQPPSVLPLAIPAHSTMSQGPSTMGTRTKGPKAHGLYKLYRSQLFDMYWAEKALLKQFPKMIRHAHAHKLAETLYILLDSTRKHINRLEALFSSSNLRPVENRCKAMDGLIKETTEVIQSTEVGYVGDAGILSSGQKMEHYGMAGYQVLQALAETLGEARAAAMLKYTLEEKKQAAEVLAGLAMDYLVENEFTGTGDAGDRYDLHP